MLNVLNFKLNLSIELTANKAITVPKCKIPISLEIEILHEKGKKMHRSDAYFIRRIKK